MTGAKKTYPRVCAGAHNRHVAAVTGRLDPTPDVAADGAWKEAPVGGTRSRRPGTTAAGEASSNGAGFRRPPSVAQGPTLTPAAGHARASSWRLREEWRHGPPRRMDGMHGERWR